jgi:hypothetical protein
MLTNQKSCKHHLFPVTFVTDIKAMRAGTSATFSPDLHQKKGATICFGFMYPHENK